MAAVSSFLLAAAATAATVGGVQAVREGKKQAAMAESQAAQAAAETKRQTERAVTLEERNIKDTSDRQRLAFLASGVTLEGSPLLVLEETRRLGAENLTEIKEAGKAGAEAQLAEGRVVAQSAKSAGRQGLLSGLSSGASSLARIKS